LYLEAKAIGQQVTVYGVCCPSRIRPRERIPFIGEALV
jgi:hypothetical protein